jgi:hypothetical protein
MASASWRAANATGVWLYTRNGCSNFADCFPRIVEAVKSLPVQSCFIDGEAIVVDCNGLALFELCAPLIWAGCGNLPKTSQANFRFAFDRGGAFNRGSCPAREEKRLCPGPPRYSSKCASVLRSTAICRLSFEHICRPRARQATDRDPPIGISCAAV